MAIIYVYPKLHRVSFTLVAQKHIEYLRRYVDIVEEDEVFMYTYIPHFRHTYLIHPVLYIYLNNPRNFEKVLHMRDKAVGFEVTDTDRVASWTIHVFDLFDLIVVPSQWCRETLRRSGVTTPIEVVGHGVSSEFLRKPREPRNKTLIELLRRKREEKLIYVLFQLWHCYDEQTRILTKNGFKYWYELTKEDEIATVNPITLELEYQKPEEIYVYDYDGIMIHFEGEHYDLLVTPNHRMFVSLNPSYITPKRRKEERKWFIKYAIELAQNNEWRKYKFCKVCKWKGKHIDYFELPDVELDDCYPTHVLEKKGEEWKYRPKIIKKVPIKPFLRFLAWFISEGNARYNKHNQEYLIFIWNKKKEYLDEIAQTIKEMGFTPIVNYEKGYVCVASKQLYIALKQLGLPVHPDIKGRKAKYKFIPSFIKELSPELISEFVFTLWKGDGSFYRTKDGKIIPLKYTTTSKKLAEDLVELILKMGYSASIYTEKRRGKWSTVYHVIFIRRYLTPAINKPPKIIHYKGKVWCVKVPNGLVIVERNGKIVISGNSGTRKGADLVYEVVKRVQERYRNVVLVIKRADILDPWLGVLKSLRSVEVAGWFSEEDMVDLYDICDIYLLFSRGGGFEIVGLEALARGEIVLVPEEGSWIDYCGECVKVRVARREKVFSPTDLAYKIHVGNGVVIDVDDAVKKLSEVIEHLDEYKEKFAKLAEKVRREWTWEKQCEKLYNVLKRYKIV